MKIDSMTRFRKAKDRKLLLNNPPKKETHLKGSKDLETVIDAPFKKGQFGGIVPTKETTSTNPLQVMGGKELDFTRRASLRFDLLAIKKQIDGLTSSQNPSPAK
jgi:hypothetical protein